MAGINLHLHQLFKNLLIKKGRGKWPDETLTTCPDVTIGVRCQLQL